MNLPFEPQELTELRDNFLISAGVVVMASVVDVPERGPMAGLVFRFTDALGGFHPPVLLVMEDSDVEGVPGLITPAVEAALAEARKKRRP